MSAKLSSEKGLTLEHSVRTALRAVLGRLGTGVRTHASAWNVSDIQSADQLYRAWSSLPSLGSLKVENSVGATIPGRPIDFPSMNFGSFHRLSRRLSPTGGSSLQLT